ncbi:MAG: ATP synthase F1 subunit gamma [Candidatus Eisenbacteria sp.]|nr:ATP synthase F1 subunit gamma [Candidatus Eisenbacteria bacterium]
MATLKQIRRRVRSVQSTRQITKAMEMVAAAKLRKAQVRAQAARPYAAATAAVLGRLAGAARSCAHPLFERRDERRVLVVVVASDKGLCGSFNAHLLDRAETHIVAEVGWARAAVMPVGQRAYRYFTYRDRPLWEAIEHLGDQIDATLVQSLSRRVTDAFLAHEVDRVEFVCTRFITTARREVEICRVIPVAPEQEQRQEIPYIFEPDAQAVLGALLPRCIRMRILSIIADSLAAEHSARMLAMGNATRNADDMIADLTLTANKLRQSVITKELLDIVGGSAGAS